MLEMSISTRKEANDDKRKKMSLLIRKRTNERMIVNNDEKNGQFATVSNDHL